MAQTATKFRPYRGTDEQIQLIPYQSGYIYFATDTGRIYLDYEEKRIAMGGSGAALYYATDYEVSKNIDDEYFIDLDKLDEPEMAHNIKINDLIINIDGAFYRVKRFNLDNQAVCNRIAISGSGGGSSGGGSGDGEENNRVSVEILDPIPKVYIYGKDYYARIKVTSPKDRYVYAEVRTINNDGKINNKIYTGISGEEITVNVGELVMLTNNFRLEIIGSSDNTLEYTWVQKGCQGYELYLAEASSFNTLKAYEVGTFNFICIPQNPGFSGVVNLYIDDSTIPVTKEYKTSQSGNDFYISLPDLTHGTHTLRAEMVCNINGLNVYTNELRYEVAIFEPNNSKPLIWCPKEYKKEIGQYEDQLIEFRVWTSEAQSNNNTLIETHFYKDDKEIASSPRNFTYSPTDSKNHVWSITNHNVGNNNYKISVGTTIKYITFTALEDTMRDLNIISEGLVLNLDSAGRSNAENFYSKTRWESTTNSDLNVEFNNFNWYNNGWISDANGHSCLRISNGASIKIPIESLGITRNKNVENYICYEFRFKPRNVKEYNSLIATEEKINETSGKLETIQTFSTDKGVLGKLFGTSGLCIGTQDAFFKSAQSSVYVKYKEDEIFTLSIVIDAKNENYPLIYIYLNGILSGIALYNKETDDFSINDDFIIMNSEYCDIDLYNIRIYKGKKMYSQNIVHNNIADKKDVKAYDLNKIVEVKNNIPTIKFSEMINYNNDHPDETLMPYMIIRSHSADNKLPFVKGGKKPVDITFKNPALDYAYKQGYITLDQYIHGAPSFYFTSEKDSLDVQGTSSQSYPRRNYKWKAKQKDLKWYYTIDDDKLNGVPIYKYDAEASAIKEKDVYVGSEIEGKEYKKYYLDSNIGETTFCLKADYMESSGTHNTGFASFVSTLYDKHPLEYYISGDLKNKDSIRTTIYGFPILVFQQIDDDNYEFIGRYNFNLDKGATDTCGFTYDDDSKIVESINEEAEEKKYKPFKDIAECWELKNNQGARCSYTKLDFEETSSSYREVENLTASDFVSGVYYIYDPEDQSYKVASEYKEDIVYYEVITGTLDWLNDFEYRYSAFEDDIDDAIEKKGRFSTESQEYVNSFLNEKFSNFIKLATWLNSTNVQDPNILGAEFEEPKIIDEITYTHDTEKYRLAKFRTEFNKHLNLDYCIIYFIMTELLHLYDSRGKNCMMASWGPTVEDEEYIWFPIFYDIDTQLGINNSGVPTWDYDVEPTKDKKFSTSNSVLWNNLWACFSDSIKQKYGELRLNTSGKGINIFNLDGYYNAYPILDGNALDSWKDILEAKTQNKIISYGKIGKRPPMIINTDQYHKYINPTLVGYTDTSGNSEAKDGGKHFYCLQGDRALSRYQYLRNRLNYVDSLWAQGDGSYAVVQNNFKLRFTANHHETTSDNYIVSSIPVGNMNITTPEEYPMALDADVNTSGVLSYLKQYNRCYFDQTPTEAVYCNGIDPITINAPSGIQKSVQTVENYSQQLVYYGNPNYIADLGDLSKKYIDEISIGALKRLKRLQLGSDEPGYYNNNPFKSISFDFAYDDTGEPLYGLLEEVILTGLSSSSLNIPVNFSGCEKLKIFRALNTQITGISLPEGTAIQTLHLPATVTGLKLVEPVALTRLISSPGDLIKGFNEGLYIDKITIEADKINYNEVIPFNSYYIEGGQLGYDSYRLLERLYNFKENASAPNDRLSINLRNVDWSPFQLVEYGDPYIEENKDYYYRDNDRFGLELYFGGETYWDSDTLNGKIYLLKEEFRDETGALDANKIPITAIDIFENFIESYENAKRANNYVLNNYTNGESNDKFSYPEITGNIYIHNSELNPYDEAMIINILKQYYPEVKFFFNKVTYAYRSLFVKVEKIKGDKGDELEKETVEFIESKSIDTPASDLGITYPPIVPEFLNKDFMGWSLNKDAQSGSEEVYHKDYTSDFETKWANFKYTSTETYIKFYAIFEPTRYKVYFMNCDKNGGISQIISKDVEAGTEIGYPDVLPSIDESALPDDERYKHLGWVSDTKYCYPDSEAEAKRYLVDLNKVKSENGDKIYYACYIPEKVTDSVTEISLFTFEGPKTFADSYGAGAYRIDSGYVIRLRSGVQLNGKITIPGTYNDLPVFGIENITNQPGLTHIYFEKPENVRYFSTISHNSNLVYIDYPANLRELNTRCLEENPKLRHPDGLGNTKLTYAGNYIFVGSFDPTLGAIENFQIPGTIKNISSYAFANIHPTSPSISPGQYRIINVMFGNNNEPCNLDLSTISGINIFAQKSLTGVPEDEGASTSTCIHTYIFYKASGATLPTLETFTTFVKSKLLGTSGNAGNTEAINIEVVESQM